MKKIILLLLISFSLSFAQEPFWKQYITELQGVNIQKILFNEDNSKLYIQADSNLYSYNIAKNVLDTLYTQEGLITQLSFYNNNLYIVKKINSSYFLLHSLDEGNTWNEFNIPDFKGNIYVHSGRIYLNRYYQAGGPYPPPPSITGIYFTDTLGNNLQSYNRMNYAFVGKIGPFINDKIYCRAGNGFYPMNEITVYNIKTTGEIKKVIDWEDEYFVDSLEVFYYTKNSYLYQLNDSTKKYYTGNVYDMLFPKNSTLIATSFGFSYKINSDPTFTNNNTGMFGVGKSLALDDSNYIYIASSKGIFKSNKIWQTPIYVGVKDEHLPKSFSLEQNYPNPFNPSTTIRFSLPEQSFVTIKVFDVLGREIKTLLNEEKSIGSYEINFNAEGLTSGVYFYRIDAGKYSETKKMLLMK